MNATFQIFKSPTGKELRALQKGSGYFFAATDTARALGYANPRDAIKRHVDEEDKGIAKHDTPGGVQNVAIISEPGLYSLILSSKLPEAKAFKRWITAEVLPALRQSGSYSTTPALPAHAESYLWTKRQNYYYVIKSTPNHELVWIGKFIRQTDAEYYCNLMNSTPTLDATR